MSGLNIPNKKNVRFVVYLKKPIHLHRQTSHMTQLVQYEETPSRFSDFLNWFGFYFYYAQKKIRE